MVLAEKLCPFEIVDGSHNYHGVSRERIADTVEDLETAEWKVYIGVCSGADMSRESDLYCLDMMTPVKPVWFDVAASEWGVALDLLRVIKRVAFWILRQHSAALWICDSGQDRVSQRNCRPLPATSGFKGLRLRPP